jgi:hypothetical protein
MKATKYFQRIVDEFITNLTAGPISVSEKDSILNIFFNNSTAEASSIYDLSNDIDADRLAVAGYTFSHIRKAYDSTPSRLVVNTPDGLKPLSADTYLRDNAPLVVKDMLNNPRDYRNYWRMIHGALADVFAFDEDPSAIVTWDDVTDPNLLTLCQGFFDSYRFDDFDDKEDADTAISWVVAFTHEFAANFSRLSGDAYAHYIYDLRDEHDAAKVVERHGLSETYGYSLEYRLLSADPDGCNPRKADPAAQFHKYAPTYVRQIIMHPAEYYEYWCDVTEGLQRVLGVRLDNWLEPDNTDAE